MEHHECLRLVRPAVEDYKRRLVEEADRSGAGSGTAGSVEAGSVEAGEGGAEPGTLQPSLLAVRDGRVVCVVTAARLEVVLDCAAALAIGMAPQALVLAVEVGLPSGQTALGYLTMTRERDAAFSVQRFTRGPAGGLALDEPVAAGQPGDQRALETMAAAMTHRPLNPATVLHRQDVPAAPDEPTAPPASARGARGLPYLSPERGRLALDAGTAASLLERVESAGGSLLVVATSSAHGQALVDHGLPRHTLLGA